MAGDMGMIQLLSKTIRHFKIVLTSVHPEFHPLISIHLHLPFLTPSSKIVCELLLCLVPQVFVLRQQKRV